MECPTTPESKLSGLGCFRFARRYLGNRICFLFLQVLRCFSSLGLLYDPMYSGHNTLLRPTNLSTGKPMFIFADRKGGFPHSEITGSKGARASPVLIAACHVLHRLSMPRHPSEALMRLIVLSKTHDRTEMFEHALCQTMMSSKVRPKSAGCAPD